MCSRKLMKKKKVVGKEEGEAGLYRRWEAQAY